MSHSNEKNELREYATSWILVSTVFLALELSASTFTLNYFLSKNHQIIIYCYLGCGMILPMGASLAMFLAARDPRLKNLSIGLLIDVGVGLAFASVVIGTLSIAYGLLVITHSTNLAICALVGILSGVLIFYPVCYYKYIDHKRKSHDSKGSQKSLT